MAKVQAINGGDVQVKAKSRAKTLVKSLTKGGVHVLKPSLKKRALARLEKGRHYI